MHRRRYSWLLLAVLPFFAVAAEFEQGPLQAVYYATKSYVLSFSNALAEELSSTGITVTTLLPGATDTRFGATSGMDNTRLFKRTVSPNLVARQGYNGMMKGKLNVISGLTLGLRMAMPVLPLMPKRAVLKAVRRLQES